MKILSISLLTLCALATSYGATIQVDIPSTPGWAGQIIDGNNFTDYDTVEVVLADNLHWFNTDQRLVLNPKDNTTYSFWDGAEIQMASSNYNALVLGETSNVNTTYNFYTNVTNVKTMKNIILRSTVNIYSNFTFSNGVFMGEGSTNVKTGGNVSFAEYNKGNITVETGGILTFNRFTATSGFTMTISGGQVNMQVGSITSDNKLTAGGKIKLDSGSFVHSKDKDNNYLLGVNGVIEVNGGEMTLSAQFNRGSQLTVNGGNYKTLSSQILNGGTMVYKSGKMYTETIALVATSTIKLYNDLTFTESETGIRAINFRDLTDDGILNLYTNGFDFTTEKFYSSDGSDIRVNLIVEKDYNWLEGEGTIHFKDMSVDAVKEIINEVKIGDIVMDKETFLTFTSDGETGTYINVGTVVPEPAEWASIVGAIVLGVAIYRRRR